MPRTLRPGVKPKDPFEGKISKPGLLRLVSYLRPRIEKFNKRLRSGSLTYFEIVTVLAFLYFKENNIEFAVLETGLGGRLDATNLVHSLVSVITPLSYEHTAIYW